MSVCHFFTAALLVSAAVTAQLNTYELSGACLLLAAVSAVSAELLTRVRT